jgi:arylsulfatase A-like enzyme
MKANHYAIRLGQDFLAQRLADHGYQTGHIGKWHLRGRGFPGPVEPGPRRLGFQTFLIPEFGHDYTTSAFYRDDGQPRTTQRYAPDYQTDHAIEFMDHALKDSQGRPFFAWVCYGLPHFPNAGPDYWLKLYRPNEVVVPPDVPKLLEREVRKFLAGYYGMVACVDYQIGRLLSWLDHAGIADDTLVMVVSDHGDTAGQHGDPPIWKKSYYRSASHVPLLVRWPGHVPAGRANDRIVDPAVDIYPTLCDACQIEIPAEVQGKSFLPTLVDPDAPSARTFVYHQITRERQGPEAFPHPERGIRTREWLYVEREGLPVALFDERNDYHEMRNLIDEPGHEKVIARYRKMLYDEMEALDDDWDEEMIWPPKNWPTDEQRRAFRDQLHQALVLEVTRDAARGLPPRSLET